MKSIVIASNTSGGGKTIFSLGLMKALKNRGYKVQGYKVGPDYIDTSFHTHITGVPSRNLDLFLMGEEGVKAAYTRGRGDYGVVEGVMGIYDGKGIDSECSTAHLAQFLKLPIVLVITPKAQVATLCAELNGILNFEGANIIGIVLNNISEGYYKLLKAAIEHNCTTRVFGYIPNNEALKLESRHLGLIQSVELADLDQKIQICSELLEKYVDLDSLLYSFKESEEFEDNFHYNSLGIRIAVAYDEAFNFYYRENIELLEELGEVVYFSPLRDISIPENVDFLYIGGGYPEVYSKTLMENSNMRASIKRGLDMGLNCYAECGGLMYLTKAINGDEMVGFFDGNTILTKSLNNFGYAKLEIFKNSKNLKRGLKINCHEFHTSKVELNENKIYRLSKDLFDNTVKQWECGYLKNNTLAGYAHVHFMGNINFIKDILNINTIENTSDI